MNATYICPRARRFGRIAALIIVSSALAAACGSASDQEFVAGAEDLGHIHDLVLGDDGLLLAASHSGLYRIEDDARAVRIGAQHDLMSVALLPDGDLVASGHPNLLLEEFRVEDRPPLLGLARSSDGGRTWGELDLLGEADFHALVPYGDGLFAAEASGRIWFLDPATGWTELGDVEARDLAIDPTEPRQQLAPDYEGTVWVSTNGAATWIRSDDAPQLIEIEWVDADTILGVTEAGTVWSAESPAGPWTQSATGPADIETFFVDHSGSWWVSVHGGQISRTDDGGRSWVLVYAPPELQ